MKRFYFGFLICVGLFPIYLASCTPANGESVTPPTVGIAINPTATKTATATFEDAATVTTTPTKTLQPTHTLTSTPAQFALPEITMSPQESEDALIELLKTNGDCTDKCIAGIWPDEMNVQEAVDIMSQWGPIEMVEDFEGDTFIHLRQDPLYGQIVVKLSIGTWTKTLETVDKVTVRIKSSSDDAFLGEELWLSDQGTLQGFQLDNILKTYGVPSYVGYFFQTAVEQGVSLEGRTIHYYMDMHYEELNLIAGIGAMAYYDGETLHICPSKDPHGVGIEINPESSLKELEEFRPVTWEALANTDLEAFYQLLTDETNPDACIETTLEQIQTLQSYFR